jgi:hypothetical protein
MILSADNTILSTNNNTVCYQLTARCGHIITVHSVLMELSADNKVLSANYLVLSADTMVFSFDNSVLSAGNMVLSAYNI